MKKKLFIYVSIILFVFLQGCGKTEISIKNVKIELGGTVSTNIQDYISIEAKDRDKFVSNAELDISKINPMSVGEYQAVVKYEEKEILVPVIVEDTTPPTIQDVDATFVEGDQVWVNEVAKAYDLSGIETFIQLNDNSLNANIVRISQNEPIILEATDQYGNKTVKEIRPNIIKDDGNLPRGKQFISFFWFPYFEEENFVSEDVYNKIKEAYSDIEWNSEFEKGDLASYNFYKRKFKDLVDNEREFYNSETGKEIFLKDYLAIGNDVNLKELKYYFFDIDQDGYPELCLKDVTFILIFKYDSEQDMFLLWQEYMQTSYYSLMGSRTVLFESGGTSSTLYKLDEYGNILYSVSFEICGYEKEGKDELQEAYMVALPQYTEENRKIEVTKEMKQQGYIYADTEIYYFRVTEEQFDELTEDFYQAKRLAIQELEQVTYTYDELFGE